MRLMFAVFLASFFALLWAALAIARHIRRQEKTHSAQQLAPGDSVAEKMKAADRR